MTNFVFTVRFFLPTYGGGVATVVAPNVVAALSLAPAACDEGWMLLDPAVNLYAVERGMLASCEHQNGEGLGGDMYQCDDCGLVYRHGDDEDHPMPSATNAGFRAYCAALAWGRV